MYRETAHLRGRLAGMMVVRQIVVRGFSRKRAGWLLTALLLPTSAHGAERVTLQTGFDLLCDHRAADGATTRLFLDGGSTHYIDVETAAIVSEEPVADDGVAATVQVDPLMSQRDSTGRTGPARQGAQPRAEVLNAAELHEVLRGAGAAHDLDVDLLASVVHAESGSRVYARSRAGAEGLMQLMPGTAAGLGVRDLFSPKENVGGGAAYLDALLNRYHGNVAWALAAYNAGPGAVDRWHGVPPYRETRAYVARIIHEFNGRYTARLAAARREPAPLPGQQLPGGSRVRAAADRLSAEPQTAAADLRPLPHRTAEGELPR